MPTQEPDAAHLETVFDDLFPLTRSIAGPGLRESLRYLQDHIDLDIEAVPSGTDVFDWTIPPEWRVREAYLETPDGTTVADLEETNLSVVNYSAPVDRELPLADLSPHLYSAPDLPEATPYVTSYYERNWGFCLPHDRRADLPEGEYHAYIDSEFVDGELNYGHVTLAGESDQEVLLSSYLCHPSMANNELSGPLVLLSLYHRLRSWDRRYYTYRFVLAPETIGSLAYLSRHGDELDRRLVGGLVLTCLGGPREWLRYKTTRRETAFIDNVVRHLGDQGSLDVDVRPFTPISGSDERQYCSPGFDLPVGQIARTPYGEYPEYHTSADDKSFMRIEQLVRSADAIERLLEAFELGGRYRNTQPYGEPMLSERDLYPKVNSEQTRGERSTFVDDVMWVLNYSDGDHTLVDIAERIGKPVTALEPVVSRLREEGLLQRLEVRA